MRCPACSTPLSIWDTFAVAMHDCKCKTCGAMLSAGGRTQLILVYLFTTGVFDIVSSAMTWWELLSSIIVYGYINLYIAIKRFLRLSVVDRDALASAQE